MLQTDWPAVQYLGSLGRWTACSLCSVVLALIIYLIYVHLCLLRRYLGIRFGERLRPDATKAVIITGATSGFGLAVAKRLFSRGFTVFACYYNDQEPGHRQLEDLRATKTSGSQHLFLVKMDVRSAESIEAAAQEVHQLLQTHRLRLHCLLNNAGISTDGPFEFTSGQSIRNLLDTNVAGVYLVTRAFVLRLIKDQGRVLNVSSGVQFFPSRGFSLYGSTKAALAYFSESLHEDLRLYGAGCYTILPGNYILQSNILFTRISSFQKSVAELSDEERELYGKKIAAYKRILNSLLGAKLAGSREDPSRLAQLHGIELPAEEELNRRNNRPRRTPSLFGRLIAFVARLAEGGGGADLDNSDAIDCFESAVVLRHPPTHTYAGNNFYQFLAGPIVDYLPKFALKGVGNKMSNSLSQSK